MIRRCSKVYEMENVDFGVKHVAEKYRNIHGIQGLLEVKNRWTNIVENVDKIIILSPKHI